MPPFYLSAVGYLSHLVWTVMDHSSKKMVQKSLHTAFCLLLILKTINPLNPQRIESFIIKWMETHT